MSKEQLETNQNKADGFFNAIGDFFTSWGASGTAWQLTLCSSLGLILIFYLIFHFYKPGSEYVQLNKDQMQTLNNLIANFPDSGKQTDVPFSKEGATLVQPPPPKDSSDTAKAAASSKTTTSPKKETIAKNQLTNSRDERDKLIIKYLQNEYNEKLGERNLDSLKSFLYDLNNKDAGTFLKDKMLLSKSFFWLTGNCIYLEAWMWSLIGVLVSLIYYVSIANTKSQNTAGDDDSGPFDPKAVSVQIAKMFYAPVCTLVLILGYHYMSDKNGNMVDLAVNKGVIIFSFICGFFSGRVMTFLVNLKDLILPISGTSKPPSTTTSPVSKTDVSFKLMLSDEMKNDQDATAIIATAFKDAVIVLTPSDGGKEMTFKKLPDEKGNAITVKQLTPGNYSLKATMAFKKDDANIINLEDSEPVSITSDTKEVTISLDKA